MTLIRSKTYNTKQQELLQDLHDQFLWKSYTKNAVGFDFPKGEGNKTWYSFTNQLIIQGRLT